MIYFESVWFGLLLMLASVSAYTVNSAVCGLTAEQCKQLASASLTCYFNDHTREWLSCFETCRATGDVTLERECEEMCTDFRQHCQNNVPATTTMPAITVDLSSSPTAKVLPSNSTHETSHTEHSPVVTLYVIIVVVVFLLLLSILGNIYQYWHRHPRDERRSDIELYNNPHRDMPQEAHQLMLTGHGPSFETSPFSSDDSLLMDQKNPNAEPGV